VIGRGDVQRALDEKTSRASRLRDRTQESILQDVALIDTAGSRLGQVNGLSVLELGGFRFGRPTRITCRVRPGAGKVVDIEREAELGGPIHSKGVLILSGFLAGRPAGIRTGGGGFAEGSVNRLVEERLEAYAQIRQSFGRRALAAEAGPA